MTPTRLDCFSFSHFRFPSVSIFCTSSVLCFLSSSSSFFLSFFLFRLNFQINKLWPGERPSRPRAAAPPPRTSESVSDKTPSVRPFVYLISNPICFRSQATSTLGLRKHASSPRRQRHATGLSAPPPSRRQKRRQRRRICGKLRTAFVCAEDR